MALSKAAGDSACDRDGWTPLHHACRLGDTEVAMGLIAAGGDVNGRTNYDMTPLHLACSFGTRKMVSMLIAAGGRASVDVKNTLGFTPLHCASQKGNIGAVRLLLEAGATPDLRAKYGARAQDITNKAEIWLMLKMSRRARG